MKKSDRSSYSVTDFQQWMESDNLVISPKFQRRGVWNRSARSYLIDTILLDLPVPPIYLRVTQSEDKKKTIREVIDGQQRISAVLDYVSDKFPLYKNIDSDCVGKYFSDLEKSDQSQILGYSFICEVFKGVQDADILKIFARLNTHSVKLNSQELRNGRFFGEFKQTAYALAFQHLEFWRQQRIFTEMGIARMNEVELTSELLIAMMAGLQDKKKSIDEFYASNEDEFPGKRKLTIQFRQVIDEIVEAVGDELSETEFRRSPLFYSMFLAIFHRIHGVPELDIDTPALGKLSRQDKVGLQDAIQRLSNVLTQAKDPESGPTPARYEAFVTACQQQTDNLRPRKTRLSMIYERAFG